MTSVVSMDAVLSVGTAAIATTTGSCHVVFARQRFEDYEDHLLSQMECTTTEWLWSTNSF